MITKEKQDLIAFLEETCDSFSADRGEYLSRAWEVRDVKNSIGMYDPKTCECGESECSPNYEKINDELRKEIGYWKDEHQRLREENMRLLAILRTVEQFTNKDLLG